MAAQTKSVVKFVKIWGQTILNQTQLMIGNATNLATKSYCHGALKEPYRQK